MKQSVLHIYNAFGKPIELLITEIKAQLCITLKKGDKKRVKHDSPSQSIVPNGLRSGASAEPNGFILANGFSKHNHHLSNGQSTAINTSNQFTNQKRDVATQSPSSFTAYHHLESSTTKSKTKFYHGNLIKSLTIMFMATLLVFLISLALGSTNYSKFERLLPASLSVVTILPIYLCYFCFIQVIEESLIILKQQKIIKLSNDAQTNETGPNKLDLKERLDNPTLSREYSLLYIQKYRLRPQTTLELPLKDLKIGETLKANRILYSLVIESTSPQQERVDHKIFFANFSPKLDCLENILSRIEAFSLE